MSLGCRICQRTEVEKLISIHRPLGKLQKKISDMLNDIHGSKMAEDDRLPQHVCNECFEKLDQAYSLRMKYRRSWRVLYLTPEGGIVNGCFICCASNDEKKLRTIDCFSESQYMKIRDMIEHLIDELIKDRSPKYICSTCLIELDFAYEFRWKCLDSEMNWLKRISYPRERMDVDGSNSEQLIIDEFAEVVQVGKGKVQCSVCRLVVDLKDLGEKCGGCMLEFLNRATMEPNADSGEGREEEYDQKWDALVEDESEDDHLETNFATLGKLNSEHMGYVEVPAKVFNLIEQYPDDPYPKVVRKGPYCCKCYTFFATTSDLADHQTESHAAPIGSGKFSCDVCLTVFDNEQALEKHRKRLDTFVYWFCRSCQVVLESPRLFRQHKLMYHMDLNVIKEAELNFEKERVVSYNCCVLHCYNRYSSEDQLQKHLKVAHGQEEKSVQEETCQYCKGTFSSKSHLLNHWRVEKEKYRCRIDGCNYMRFNKSAMWLHCSVKPHAKEFYEMSNVVLPDMEHFTLIGELDSNTEILQRDCQLCCRCFLCFETKEELTAHCELHRVEDNQPFQCAICRRGFTQEGLARHIKLQEIPCNYYCRPCKRILWQKDDYVMHKIANHLYDDDLSDKIKTEQDHSFTCCGCWKAFQTEDQLIQHRKKHHPPPVLPTVLPKTMMRPKCDYCHQFMRSMQSLEQHIATYESRVFHSCKIKSSRCAFQTKDMDHMRRHIIYDVHKNRRGPIIRIKNKGPDNHHCCFRRCDFRCINYDVMIEHGQVEHADRREQLSIYHKGRQFSCPVCCKGFDLLTSLHRHKRHRNNWKCSRCERAFWPIDTYFAHVSRCTKSWKCKICGKKMSSKGALIKHIRFIHTAEESDWHVCGTCGKQVKKIKQHMLLHATKWVYKCSLCQARFKTTATLKKHERKHSNVRRFPCRQGCDKRYVGSECRDRHENAVHLGIKPFVCEICEKSYASALSLRQHQRKHTGLKMYPCLKCSASFDKLSKYKQHCTQHDTDIE